VHGIRKSYSSIMSSTLSVLLLLCDPANVAVEHFMQFCQVLNAAYPASLQSLGEILCADIPLKLYTPPYKYLTHYLGSHECL
jgi:hypothetical protein